MITFLDENGDEYGALSSIKVTNAVNGERSVSGTIYTNEAVLERVDKGWRLRFDDEYYTIIYAKPVDIGDQTQVSFDAVHQFFYDFDKSSIYSQLKDGSHTFEEYLRFIFDGSGYSYRLEVGVKAFEKQSFGFKSRLSLFNDVIKSAGVEFSVSGKVVRILEKVGTDLSTVVRKHFNMNELKIEKNIGDFITYKKGFGAYVDEEDHSKGRLEVEYESPLAKAYGRLEGEPLVDERYSVRNNLLSALKKAVDESYTISVQIDMEDLTKAGYSYTQPIAGDYIMAINETLHFQEKIRIVSFTSEYDVAGNLLSHAVTCNDLGTAQKQSTAYSSLSKKVNNQQASAENALAVANLALISADGKNRNYYGSSMPEDLPKGTLKKGDILYLTVGDQVKMYFWNGADWIIFPYSEDIDTVKNEIKGLKAESARYEQEFMQGLQDATSNAEANAQAMREQLESQIADETQAIKDKQAQFEAGMSQDRTKLVDLTQKVGTLSSQQTADKQSLSREIASAKSSVASVASDLATAKTSLNNAVAQANTKATSLEQSLSQARQTLEQQGRDLVTQANAQAEMRTLTSEVKKLADGTKTEVTELSKTLSQNGKDIASVSARTKTVEDTLAGTATKITELTKQGEATSRKTAELTSGLESTNAKFSSIWTGARNLLVDTEKLSAYDPLPFPRNNYLGKAIKRITRRASDTNWVEGLRMQVADTLVNPKEMILSFYVFANRPVRISCFMYNPNGNKSVETSDGYKVASASDGKAIISVNSTWQRVWVKWTYQVSYTARPWVIIGRIDDAVSEDTYVNIVAPALYHGHHTREWAPSDLDVSEKIAEYEQSAERNYASLQSSLTTLSGTVTQNKTSIEQTAQGLKTRIESLESYKDAEGNRATQYFELAKTETAKQITAERIAITNNYVAKSTYQEDANGITRQLTATETVANNAATKIATYQETNDRRVAALETAKSSTDGTLTQLSNKVEQNAQQTRETISAVEAKIPTEYKGNMLLDSGKGWRNTHHVTFALALPIVKGQIYTVTARWWRNDNSTLNVGLRENDSAQWGQWMNLHYDSVLDLWTATFTAQINIPAGQLFHFYTVENNGLGNADFAVLTKGAIPMTNWSAVSSEIATEISNAKLDITKTAEGLKLTANKVEGHDKSITQHTTQITAINNEFAAKVSKTEYNELAGRVTGAETNIRVQADEISKRLTSTQVESAITAKGYQTKADVDNNIAGRGFATATTLENKVRETVEGYTREISRVEGLISTETSGNILLASNVGVTNAHSSLLTLAEPIVKGKTYTVVQHWWKSGSTPSTGQPLYCIDSHMTDNGSAQYVALRYDSTIDSWTATFVSTVDVAKGTRIRFANTDYMRTPQGQGSWTFTTLVVGNIPLSSWQPHWSEQATVTALNAVKSTADEHTRTLTSLQNDTLKKAEVSITSDKIVLGVGKEINGRTFSTMIAQNSQYVDIIAEKLRVSGNMIVDGTITSKDLAVGSVTAAQILANAVTTEKLAANAVTADKLLADQALFNKLKANQAYLKTLFTTDAFAQTVKTIDLVADKITTGTLNGANVNLINLNASNITSGRLSANMISGGVLSSLNGSVYFDLNNSKLDFNQNATIEFKSASNAIFRKRNVHTAFLHFQDTTLGGVPSVYASLGITRGNHGINSASSGRFAGIRIFSTSATTDPNGSSDALHEAKADQIELYGDKIILTHGFGGNAITLRASQLDKNYDLLSWMQGVKKAIQSLSNIWSHANNVNWDFVNSNDLRRAVYNELNSFGWGNGL